MTTYGDFQSIFQLTAGLTLGVSGLVTLFEDPIEREIRRFSRLWKVSDRLNVRHPNLPPDIVDRINGISNQIEEIQERLSTDFEAEERFRITKLASFVASVVGLVLLIYSSEKSSEIIPFSVKLLSYVLLAYVPIAVIFIAGSLRSISWPYRQHRKQIEESYVSIVNSIWDSPGKQENEGGKMG
ncbi:hypothetical protein [Sphingomonas sp. LT1P40]|uniref:hypothetical protein n=1 Tax=Alteristakelama amylovorans TaxID=3096166 RepID=UPI002FC873B0